MSQSNTRAGDIRVLAGEDLTGKEGYLVKMTHDSGVAEVKLPAAVSDYAVYVVIEAAEDGELCTVRPIFGNRNVRIKLAGTCNPGDFMCLAAIANSDNGQVRALPAASSTYRGLGIAEEAGVDEQLVLVRPVSLGNITT